MNTNYLSWSYNEIYKSFFNKYDLVISSPIHFIIVWDTSIYWNGNWSKISHKIPIRNYIWINFTKKLEQIEFIYKENAKQEFKKGNIENYYQIDVPLLKSIWLDYEIWFLSEYNWLDQPSIISNILVSKLLLDWEISIEDISKLDINNPDYKGIYNKIVDLDEKLLREFNFFWNIRNNSSFLWTSLLSSPNHLLAIIKNNKVNYIKIWWDSDYNLLDLSISIISTNTFIKTTYKPKLIIESDDSLKKFCAELWIDNWDASLMSSIESLSKIYSLRIFKDLHGLYNNSDSNSFFHNVHSYRKALKSIFKSFVWNFTDIRKLRETFLSYIPYNYLNIFIDQIWICWDARIIIFSNKLWIIDDELIYKINESMWLNMTLDYSSFYDWYERWWLKIEQYKDKWIFSKFCSWINVRKIYKNSLFYENIEKKDLFSKEDILILSKIDKNIYLQWKKLTSKDLKSQNFTIDLFERLFDNNFDISNKSLPISSYSNNKNELTWKIVLPIINLIKEKLWKKINIECQWGINNYNIKLINSDIEIYII